MHSKAGDASLALQSRPFALSPEAPVTYREFAEFMQRVDHRAEKLDKEKADVKDVDVVGNMVREVAGQVADLRKDVSGEVAGLRKVLIGFMVAIAIGAVTYSFATFQLLASNQPAQTQGAAK